MIKQNLHTHSIYCDGNNTLEEMTQAAIKCGFSSLGFSGHCYTPFDDSYCMSLESSAKYCSEIDRLKEKYKGTIKIYKGIEYDVYSEYDKSLFDYIIGSVHYVVKDGAYLDVDLSAENFEDNINKHFNGDGMAFARAYFDEVLKIPEKTNCHILGHFDLVSKFSETNDLIAIKSCEYLDLAYNAISKLSKKIKVFEVNTGAMARGYRTTPYPSVEFVREMRNLGMMPVISSDCHDARQIDFAYDIAYKLIKDAGYSTALAFDDGKFVEYPV